jgi:hypothetical protein
LRGCESPEKTILARDAAYPRRFAF